MEGASIIDKAQAHLPHWELQHSISSLNVEMQILTSTAEGLSSKMFFGDVCQCWRRCIFILCYPERQFGKYRFTNTCDVLLETQGIFTFIYKKRQENLFWTKLWKWQNPHQSRLTRFFPTRSFFPMTKILTQWWIAVCLTYCICLTYCVCLSIFSSHHQRRLSRRIHCIYLGIMAEQKLQTFNMVCKSCSMKGCPVNKYKSVKKKK